MGTTTEKLTYLQGTKDAIKNAIEAKGVEVPEGTTFRGYAEKVGEIGIPKQVKVTILGPPSRLNIAYFQNGEAKEFNGIDGGTEIDVDEGTGMAVYYYGPSSVYVPEDIENIILYSGGSAGDGFRQMHFVVVSKSFNLMPY